MASDRNRLEFERIRNLTAGFGWTSAKEEISDTDLIMVLTKKRVDMPAPGEGMPPT